MSPVKRWEESPHPIHAPFGTAPCDMKHAAPWVIKRLLLFLPFGTAGSRAQAHADRQAVSCLYGVAAAVAALCPLVARQTMPGSNEEWLQLETTIHDTSPPIVEKKYGQGHTLLPLQTPSLPWNYPFRKDIDLAVCYLNDDSMLFLRWCFLPNVKCLRCGYLDLFPPPPLILRKQQEVEKKYWLN